MLLTKTCLLLFNSMSSFSRKKVYGRESGAYQHTLHVDNYLLNFCNLPKLCKVRFERELP